jgi:hypothetical protein
VAAIRDEAERRGAAVAAVIDHAAAAHAAGLVMPATLWGARTPSPALTSAFMRRAGTGREAAEHSPAVIAWSAGRGPACPGVVAAVERASSISHPTSRMKIGPRAAAATRPAISPQSHHRLGAASHRPAPSCGTPQASSLSQPIRRVNSPWPRQVPDASSA